MKAEDFRYKARQALSGNWPQAIAVTFVAGILGADTSRLNFSSVINTDTGQYFVGQWLDKFPALAWWLKFNISSMLTGAVAFGLLIFLIGGAVNVGLCRYHTLLVSGQPRSFATLFEPFQFWFRAFALQFLTWLFVLLWSLLLIVPGIMAGYSYAMAPYILADDPNVGATQAISLSMNMMYGHRWRLFCLQFSFIGWDLLSLITLGLAGLGVAPYRAAAVAAFYLNLSGQGLEL